MRFLKYLLKTYTRHKTRFLAAICGFSVALGTIFVVSSYIEVMNTSMKRFFMVQENSVMVVSKGCTMLQVIPFNSHLPEESIGQLQECVGVTTVIPLIFKDHGNESHASLLKDVVVGIRFSTLQTYLREVPLREGRWPRANLFECIVGPEVQDGNVSVDSRILVNGIAYTITGILGSENPVFDSFIYCEYETVQTAYQMDGYFTMALALVDHSITDPATLRTRILQRVENAEVLDASRLEELSGSFFQLIHLLQAVIGLVPLGISVMFVLVLMVLAVKEQEQEFAVMRAIGISPRKIGGLVFVQTMLLGLISVGFGLLFGFFFFGIAYSRIVGIDIYSVGVVDYFGYIAQKIPLNLYGELIAAALAIGAIVALGPSIQASRIEIVDQLRRH